MLATPLSIHSNSNHVPQFPSEVAVLLKMLSNEAESENVLPINLEHFLDRHEDSVPDLHSVEFPLAPPLEELRVIGVEHVRSLPHRVKLAMLLVD